MLCKYSNHHYQYSYPVVNSHYSCISWAEGSSERQFGTATAWSRSPSPDWGPIPSKGYWFCMATTAGFQLSNAYKTFLDWLWTFGRKARLVKFGLGLVGGQGPEVYSHDRCRLVGW